MPEPNPKCQGLVDMPGASPSLGFLALHGLEVALGERTTNGLRNLHGLPELHGFPRLHGLHDLPHLLVVLRKSHARDWDALRSERLPELDLLLCERAVPAN